VLKLCRLRYGGSASMWGFAIYRASHDDYQPSYLPTGHSAGGPEDALDTACGLYLGDPTAWTSKSPDELPGMTTSTPSGERPRGLSTAGCWHPLARRSASRRNAVGTHGTRCDSRTDTQPARVPSGSSPLR